MGVVALAALVGLSPAVPGLSALAATSPTSASTAVSTTSTEDLAAYRRALLDKQSSAVDIGNESIKALHELKVKELGYEPSVTDPREIADQYSCYDKIIMRESKWNPYADNPHSSAYGIPQALPGSKMAAFGSDWRTNPVTQIRWGLDYVDKRYGTPCGAWGFKRWHGWY
jgi:hypothetical protein